jgi:photosystem II stability/assembly factor-like uncharacterized protein
MRTIFVRRCAVTTSVCVAAGLAPFVAVHAQWVAQLSGTDAELRGLSVVALRDGVVWSSGARGTVLRTTDGGGTWTQVNVPGATALDFRAIAATSREVAHVLSIGDSSRIYRTTDGGRSWSLRFTSTRKGAFFDAIQFWDARHGIAMSDPVDGKFLLVTTSDGGDSWQEIPAERLPPALAGEGAFAASGTCLVVLGSGDVWFVTGGAAVARLFHSADRGKSWTVQDTPVRAGVASAGIFSVAFADRLHGAIAGGDYQQPALRGRNLAMTSDGGATWTLADSASSPAGYRSAVTFVPNTGARWLLAVGLSGTDVSLDGGGRWANTDGVAYNSVVLVAGEKGCVAGYAVGPKGRIGKMPGC